MAAHLAGTVAALTLKPVIGVPLAGGILDGLDSLLSTVQMPAGIPVATVAVGKAGAKNAAYLACQIIAAGDAALKAVAERLVANVRDSDIVGRLGGDEFAVILVQADLATAKAKAEKLVRVIEGAPVTFGDWSAPLHITAGVRQIEPGADPETALAEADATMYVRKRERVQE